MVKRCGKCRETKTVSKFSRSRCQKDGLQKRCKECQAGERRRRWELGRAERARKRLEKNPPPPPGMVRCIRCHETKVEECFGPGQRVKRWPRCRDCRRDESRCRRERHPDRDRPAEWREARAARVREYWRNLSPEVKRERYLARGVREGKPVEWRRRAVTVACATCGRTFDRPPSHVARAKGKMYCSQKCAGVANRRPRKHCEQCGREYRSEWDSASRFCSYACHAESMRNRVVVECAECGRTLERVPAVAARSRRHFCSTRCCGLYVRRTEERRGWRSPHWAGGTGRLRAYWASTGDGREWRRNAKRKAGYRCVLCGKQHEHRSTVLHVHHVLAWARFPELRSDPRNAVVMCARCEDGKGHRWLHSGGGREVRDGWKRSLLALMGAMAYWHPKVLRCVEER